jgi:anion-transporting  ArsA/GET3 family ATPase
MSLLQRLARLELLVVTGKGGVGKSTLAAALGRILAGGGSRVLIVEVDPRESLYRLLGLPPSDGEVLRAGPRLLVQNLRPEAVIESLVREQLRVEMLARRVLGSPIYRHFSEGAPGLREMAVLGHALRVVRGEAGPDLRGVDLVILDAPASGHGVTMLEAPALVASVIRDGPFGRMSRNLARFISDPGRCGVVLATLAEEMPVQEAVETIGTLEARLSRRPEIVLVNGVYPAPETGRARDDDPVARLWRDRREINEREIGRLGRSWSGSRIDLPLLPIDGGPDLVAGLAERLLRGLEGP